MESSEQLGFSVRVGYRRALHESASGAVLYAFQPADIQERWEKLLDPALSKATLEAFRAHCRAIAKRQVELTPSQFVTGITDISAPVMRGGAAAAALTVPYIKKVLPSATPDQTAAAVRIAASRISTQLTEGDNRI
nr:IclR family transcriptional regulator C-terminal domain-containing protein [Hephaestia sp. MAHUQ-44]